MEFDPQQTINELELFPSLRVVKGKSVGQRFPIIGDRLVLGRKSGDIVLHDPEVSGAHAEVVRQGSAYVLRDLGSTNGTYVNGQPVREQVLKAGDQVALGRTILAWDAATAHTGKVESQAAPPGRKRIPVGIYDNSPELTNLGSLVEDTLVGFKDEDGTQLMEVSAFGLELRLPPHALVQLEVVGGPEKGRLITFSSGNVVVGRYGTDIVLKDQDISRRHMAIEVFGRDQIFLRDLGSTNGSYVNGQRINFSKLQSGDTLVVGRSVLQLLVKDLE